MRKWLFFILLSISFYSVAKLPVGFDYCSLTIPSLKVELKYLSSDNFTGKKVPGYLTNRCILTKSAINSLALVQQDLTPLNLGLKVYDAYRPTQAVDAFFAWSKSKSTITKQQHYPNLKKSRLFPLGYIAKKSGHSRGSTVDLTIIDLKTGEALDMGTGFDYFGRKAWPSEQTNNDATKSQSLITANVNEQARLHSIKRGMVALHEKARTIPRYLL